VSGDDHYRIEWGIAQNRDDLAQDGSAAKRQQEFVRSHAAGHSGGQNECGNHDEEKPLPS
jgi:hypothetical protein